MQDLLGKARGIVVANSPSILSGLAVAGVVITAGLAVKATPKALEKLRVLREKKAFEAGPLLKDQDVARNDSPTKVEVVKAVWTEFIPAGISGVATIACIIGANQIGLRRNAALLGAYTLADTAFREYKEAALAQLGRVKEQQVQDEVQRGHLERNPVTDAQVIITGGGDQLCFDSLTGRYFKSDVEKIRRSENEINHRVLSDMYAAHNEFYELVGLEPTSIGEELGWNIDNRIELVFTSHLASDGTPCLAIGYVRLPKVDYGKF